MIQGKSYLIQPFHHSVAGATSHVRIARFASTKSRGSPIAATDSAGHEPTQRNSARSGHAANTATFRSILGTIPYWIECQKWNAKLKPIGQIPEKSEFPFKINTSNNHHRRQDKKTNPIQGSLAHSDIAGRPHRATSAGILMQIVLADVSKLSRATRPQTSSQRPFKMHKMQHNYRRPK